jgi:hypothetical protein
VNEADAKEWFEHELAHFRPSEAERELYPGDYPGSEAAAIVAAAERLVISDGYEIAAEYLSRHAPDWEG